MKYLIVSFCILILSSCVSVPKESITLSETLGSDLRVLKQSHLNTINLYYDNLEVKINTFIDEVYAPFIIQYVLESEFESFERNQASLITFLNEASKPEATQEDTEKAFKEIKDFHNLMSQQILSKRRELLEPIQSQRNEILKAINSSYDNAIYANSTLTAYLQSASSVKNTQKETLKLIGLEGTEEYVNDALLNASDILNDVIQKGKNIDEKSDDAQTKINDLIKKIKAITN